MNKKSSQYEINEQDIDTVLAHLKRTDPQNATPEKAIALLEDLQAGIHQISHANPKKLEEMLESLEKEKKSVSEDKN
ncbi:hypothetical protein A2858_02210 [Candidatus Daviesbacteria bacterium RIFCSPHIGHO2_01_FULL_36_37]|uniref:Uncharacterized protein n=1 Tax=Candidatus Daviesbacteria bacterium RIFCSPHIGHO2_01_FULL_36_37 TaxID=1797758 RepID=A0A1F5IJV3_9BACT|nr:MAG: hypothetical protein A2858_02210 [Candidatus Daviesbacteria bacterium RIFCSPHIGHO2_01_FULL_36_37]